MATSLHVGLGCILFVFDYLELSVGLRPKSHAVTVPKAFDSVPSAWPLIRYVTDQYK